MSDLVLAVENLSVELKSRHGARLVVSNVSFDLHQRKVLGLIGESGSGKTVLSRALVNWIASPLRITGGSVKFQGRDILRLSGPEMQLLRGRDIAYIGANPGSALDATVAIGPQIVEKVCAVEPGLSRRDAEKRVLQLLDAVRIPSAKQRFTEFPFQFSGGMMQRILIVDALVSNPAFLVADNITQPLDVTIGAQILRLLRDLQKQFQTAIIFVSSSLGVVRDIADDVLVLEAGREVEVQQTAKLISAPQSPYTVKLLEKVPCIWTAETKAPSSERISFEDPILRVRDVVKTYRVKARDALFVKKMVHAVRGVSFDVMRGENFGIVGESGCGKSTLSRLLSRLELPDAGSILFDGGDISKLSGQKLRNLRRRFQLVLQDPFNAIPPHFSIGRTISEALLIHGGLTGKQVRDRVREVMEEVGLTANLYDSLPVGLSAGQRQRVNVARALALEPELLILDETLSSLDQVEQSKLLDLFERLQAKHRITYIFISHDLAMVRRVCSRVAVMYLGKVVELAENDQLFLDSRHPYTRALLSAAPVIEKRRYQPENYLLEGEPPDPIDIPSGCSFRTRCPFAFERCTQEDPDLYRRAEGGLSACYLADSTNPRAVHPFASLEATTGA
jgi:peptide/nickel transport system ATP-binding protein